MFFVISGILLPPLIYFLSTSRTIKRELKNYLFSRQLFCWSMLPVFDEGNVLISGELSTNEANGAGEGVSEDGDEKEGGAEKGSDENIPEMQFRPLYRARPSEISEASFLQVRITLFCHIFSETDGGKE